MSLNWQLFTGYEDGDPVGPLCEGHEDEDDPGCYHYSCVQILYRDAEL